MILALKKPRAFRQAETHFVGAPVEVAPEQTATKQTDIKTTQNADGSTSKTTTVTITNADGSKTVTETTTETIPAETA